MRVRDRIRIRIRAMFRVKDSERFRVGVNVWVKALEI